MFCKNCGTQLANDAVFCHKCAQSTNSTHQARTPQPQVVVHPPAKTVIVRKSSGFGTAFFTVLLLCCGIGGFYLYQKYHRETIISIPGIGKITKDQDNFYISADMDTQSNPTSQAGAPQAAPTPKPLSQRTIAPKSGERRIKFARGQSSATVSGTVAKGGPDFYVVGARAGQKITVQVNGAVGFGIDSPSGQMTEDDSNTSWEEVLPSNGDYTVRVYSRGDVQDYSLSISIE